MIESQPSKNNQSSEKLFILIGALWLILGGVILSQLPNTVPTFIKVTWETETEVDTAGFNVYRAPRGDGECADIPNDAYEQVNDQLVPSEGSTVVGAAYSYEDGSVERGKAYCYQLEDVELSGITERHDPIEGDGPRQIDRILYIILAPLSLIVGVSLIVSGLRREKKL